ncbi:hypothetical protein GGR56DRAFT_688989 [Xylariaceae sp. FL0804]|nr:hypothetical protein GGR56DRAFT_688989 [Xylariaceae sp. FL0804]
MATFVCGVLASAWSIAFLALWLPRRSSFPRDTHTRGVAVTPRVKDKMIREITNLAGQHDLAAAFSDLVHEDGAGSWPPRANYELIDWPEAIRPYKEIYLEMAPLLPAETPSLDDQVNIQRIATFRLRFQQLLAERVDMTQVRELLEAADSGRWDVIGRDTYNAFYCCLASCRHAYRWGTIPVVKPAQLEEVVAIPSELEEPWTSLQSHFGCPSAAGNNTSNQLLNFDSSGKHMFKCNMGLSDRIMASEEAFARIFHNAESLALGVYHSMILATISFEDGDHGSCARHLSAINAQLRGVLKSYYDTMSDRTIPKAIWLSRVQGFFGWGVGHVDESTGELVRFDGLSGNQILLFQAVDAFLGFEQYLSGRDLERNVPARQRRLCRALRDHSFRDKVSSDSPRDGGEERIAVEIDAMIKQLRLFRCAHRTRSKSYLSQPAPERVPMTAGKSLLASNTEESLRTLDTFMARRLSQTV